MLAVAHSHDLAHAHALAHDYVLALQAAQHNADCPLSLTLAQKTEIPHRTKRLLASPLPPVIKVAAGLRNLPPRA